MDRGISSFLDMTRFAAAFTVLLAHIDDRWVPGQAPFLGHLGIEAVGCFFVISGFVIAYVADQREKTVAIYAISRASRIYSVVIPCLVITFLLDMLGKHLLTNYEILTWPPVVSDGRELIKMIISLSFLNYSWGLAINPGSNAPFWSICFEVFYYTLFSCVFYVKGAKRIALLLLVLLLAGPPILRLFPLWMLGVALYHYRLRGLALGTSMILLSAIAWAVIEAYRWRHQLGERSNFGYVGPFATYELATYEGGVAFAALLSGVTALERKWNIPPVIAYLSNTTFVLYLLHFPVDTLLVAALPSDLSPAYKFVLCIVTPVSAALFLTTYTDKLRAKIRETLLLRTNSTTDCVNVSTADGLDKVRVLAIDQRKRAPSRLHVQE